MNIIDVKKLREQTGAGVLEAKKALDKSKGDFKKAKEILKKKGLAKAKKKANRATGEGRIYAYIHSGNRLGVLVELACETDFVAKNKDFEQLCKEVAMQVVSMAPKNVQALLKQDYVRDNTKTMADLVNEAVAKLDENIVVKRFERFEVGS